MHEVSTRHCAIITKSIPHMISEVCSLPSYDDIGVVSNFFNDYEEHAMESQRFSALDISLKSTLCRWWNAHKTNIGGWKEC